MVDARSDIFSFGAVLYEMLTGRRAFEGASQASIIAAILEREPPPLTVVAPITPPSLDRVVRKCLAKDPDRRWQSAADLCDELTWIAQAPALGQHSSSSSAASMVIAPTRPRASRLVLAAVGAVILLAGGATGWWLARGDDRTAPATRHLAITLPGTARLEAGGMAVSPDGESIVFVASDVAPGADPATASRRRRLYWRELGASASTLIPNTEDARAPFFSHDGQTVGYFTAVALMKVTLRGGTPVRVIGTPPVTRGGMWLPDGSLVMAPTQGNPLVRLPPGATATVPLTTLDEAKGERGHAWPQPLPGAEDVLFTVRHGTATDVESSDIAVVNVSTGRRELVMQGAAFGQYSPTGHLLFVKGGALSAAPFDLESRKVTGPARVLADRVAVDAWTGGAHFGITADGTLLFLAGRFSEPERTLVWVGRDGKTLPGIGMSGPQPSQPRISPDGTKAVFTGLSSEGDNEIMLADLATGTSVRFSEDPGDDFNPIWTPDGLSVIWSTLPHNRSPFLVMRAIDGSGKSEAVLPDLQTAQFTGSVSPSGVLAYTNATPGGPLDIHVVPLKGAKVPQPLLAGSAREFGPEFSPDGNWIAYVSTESGASEIYVVPYPGPGGKRQITTAGGVSPMWRRDGRELYYQTEAGLMAMDVTPGPQIQFGRARLLVAGTFFIDGTEDGPRAYDATADGKRFLMIQLSPAVAPPPTLEVLSNWHR
jgi:serine/threonine-protein kinase